MLVLRKAIETTLKKIEKNKENFKQSIEQTQSDMF